MRYVYRLDNLGCANCAAKMETGIGKIDGVDSAKIGFMSARLTIEADASKIETIEEEIVKVVRKIESDVRIRRA